MDTKEFLKKIKQYIKIEVENQLNESMSDVISENNKLRKEITLIKKKLSTSQIIEQPQQKRIMPRQSNNSIKFTSNEPINNILAETYQTMRFDSSNVNNYQTEMQEAYSDMAMESNVENDINYESSNIPDFNQMVNVKHKKPSVNEMLPDDMKHTEHRLPDFLKNALTKDYSEQLNKFDKK